MVVLLVVVVVLVVVGWRTRVRAWAYVGLCCLRVGTRAWARAYLLH